MYEKPLLMIIGIVLVILNKPIAILFLWWEAKVIKFEDPFNTWIYRIVCILFGMLFFSFGLFK